MKLLKFCLLVGVIVGAVSQSFFAFRQPKNKILSEVPVEQTKRSKTGSVDQPSEGGVEEPDDNYLSDNSEGDSTAQRNFFDIRGLLDDVIKGFADAQDTWRNEELMSHFGDGINSKGMRNSYYV
jgi:hypothetical protein